MNINLIYLSQTGNTRKVAKAMEDAFRSDQHSVRTISYKSASQADFVEPECKWCEAECPTNSIKLSPMPVVAKTCFRCYRCLTGCPENALSVKWGISNFAVWSLYNQTFERWLGDIQQGEIFY
jgi:ferredoxin